MNAPSWDDHVRPYVVHRLQQETQPRGGQARIARLTGVSTAHVSNVIALKTGVGQDFVSALCEKVWHISMAELYELAESWAAGSDDVPWHHQNLERAVAMARWQPATLIMARRLDRAWPADADRTVGQWFDLLEEAQGSAPLTVRLKSVDRSSTTHNPWREDDNDDDEAI